MKNSYQKAGVDVEAGYQVVENIRPMATSTWRPGVMNGLGSFGACFDLSELSYQKPVLVSGTDGVGTKLLLAQQWNKHDTIGIDCVAMCVNDIIAQGAEPLYFLDYIAIGKNTPELVTEIVSGIAEGCKQANMALVGGETAEMPGMYQAYHYDLAGFAVGIVEKDRVIDGSKIIPGDVLIGLPSSGIHSNGFSLVRKIIENRQLSESEKQMILTPTKIYVKTILKLLQHFSIKGMAHVTGGGFYENIPRMLPKTCSAEICLNSWEVPQVFELLKKWGDLSENEMYHIFNMGIGMVCAVSQEDAEQALTYLSEQQETAFKIGHVVEKINQESFIMKEARK